MKKMIMLCLALALLVSLSSLPFKVEAAGKASFTDTANHWAKEQIETAAQKGYVNGFPDGTFQPDDPVTRAEFIAMLVRALGLSHDEEGSIWYTTYVRAAQEERIYQGDEDFPAWNMQKEISREHMAWLAVRAADDSLLEVESSGITREAVIDRWPMTAEDNKIIRSDEDMRTYYEGFLVSEAFKRGILTGFGGSDIGLDKTTTRAQAVTVIERILTLRDGGELPAADKYAIGESELAWLKTNAFIVAPQIFDDPDADSMKPNYKVENLVFQNSTIYTVVNRIILIDLDDPKDPYRKLLPAIEKLGFRGENIGKLPNDVYAMYIEYETLYDKNPNLYWGNLSFTTQSYDTPSPYPFDRLVEPHKLNTLEKEYDQINMLRPSDIGVGKGVTVWAIPNSGYTLNPNIGSRVGLEDRGLSFTLYVQPVRGMDGGISNTIFYGTTTHYDK
ncbi:S-layer homology domain-containing protein [Paenibacillus sp. HB172176]|uniref:S-layer homology domain-containing protein n=1 Tax=Paenibacillus sp. HB172176 TaxID=2493690 RepID=UPI001439E739|nr:S-layer homology domain-containing protein [Paenibacillus sp. HB172176]